MQPLPDYLINSITLPSQLPHVELKQRVHQRLESISQRVYALDPDSHHALISSFLGGMKGAASINPVDLQAAIELLEIVMEEFDGKSLEQGQT